jgi:hypothetical protein
MFMYVVLIGRGNQGKVDHSEGKGGETAVAILMLQGCCRRLC